MTHFNYGTFDYKIEIIKYKNNLVAASNNNIHVFLDDKEMRDDITLSPYHDDKLKQNIYFYKNKKMFDKQKFRYKDGTGSNLMKTLIDMKLVKYGLNI